MELLNQLAPNALTRDDIEIEAKEGELPSTFVPGRNLVFLSFASILAYQVARGTSLQAYARRTSAGIRITDCRDEFVKSCNVTVNLAMERPFVIHTPLMWLNKAETWELADELDALEFVKNETLTCYNGIIADGCGECPACKLRANGYNEYMKMKKERA